MRPYFRVNLGRDRFWERQPFEVTIRQREFQHDVAVLRFQREWAMHTWRRGRSVSVTWGYHPGRKETFHGHVHSVQRVSKVVNGRVRVDTQVFLVGASYRMNKRRMVTYRRRTARAVVQGIARRNRLSVSTLRAEGRLTTYHERLAQLGRSDWRLLCDIVKKAGCTVSVRRTQVIVRPRTLDAGNRGVLTFRPRPTTTPSSLLEVTIKAGSSPAVKPERLVSASMDEDGRIFWTSSEDCCADEPDFEKPVKTTAKSRAAARRALSGLNFRGQFRVIAKAVVGGQPRLRCGELVRFEGTEYDSRGYWFTGTVEHRLTGTFGGRPTQYTCELEVGRDTLAPLCPTIPAPPTSWTGKPLIGDCDTVRTREPEVPTIFNPVDVCPPLDPPTPPKRRRCVCLDSNCRHTLTAENYQAWTARYTRSVGV